MDKTCGKCKTVIDYGETVIVCRGFCEDGNRFHIDCVGVPDDEAAACLRRNILWMCNCCRDLLENVKFRDIVKKLRPIEEPRNELEQLKQDVIRVNETLVELISIVKNENFNQPPKILPNTKNDRLMNALSSTRIHSEVSQEVLDDEKFGLFLTNIAPDVTDKEVQELVCDVLEVPEAVSIKRLVPVWRDQTSLEYVSFKVELHQRYKVNALDSTLWPPGVRCREFKNYSHSTWRPANRSRMNFTT